MNLYYTGNETHRPADPVLIEKFTQDDSPDNYIADPALAAAVNVAIILGKPLLLTGETGVGKTMLAYHVAMALGLGEPERFDTKSTSQAQDLFYRFNSLARFHAAHAGERDKRAMDFITFGPLGKAILNTLDGSDPLFSLLGISDFRRASPNRSVVLIDEIDKASRDFPNDLLDAIDKLRFDIHELENDTLSQLAETRHTQEIAADDRFRPLVVITSNSEKNLPEPFLRRCVFFNIPFPNDKQLLAIVARHAAGFGQDRESGLSTLTPKELAGRTQLDMHEAQPLLRSALAFFNALRRADVRKKPSTAEFIDWLRYLLESGGNATQELKDMPERMHHSLGVLVKSIDDLAAARTLADSRFPR